MESSQPLHVHHAPDWGGFFGRPKTKEGPVKRPEESGKKLPSTKEVVDFLASKSDGITFADLCEHFRITDTIEQRRFQSSLNIAVQTLQQIRVSNGKYCSKD